MRHGHCIYSEQRGNKEQEANPNRASLFFIGGNKLHKKCKKLLKMRPEIAIIRNRKRKRTHENRRRSNGRNHSI